MTDTFIWTDRIRKPWYKKYPAFVIVPIAFWFLEWWQALPAFASTYWWWMNDDNQTVDQATWYHPEWPYWRRWLIWNTFRNPLQNFRSFVFGVQDRNYTVTGKYPVLTVQRDDLQPPEYGWQWCICWTLLPRPFASYSGPKWLFQFGTQPNGFFAFVKINKHK